MKSQKRIASLSVDLDNKWSYMKMHGISGWEAFPSYLDVVVPRILGFLDERNMNATFLIVGQDAALEGNRAALESIARHGHEIGNHSFHHDTWLHSHPEESIRAEIALAEEHIERVTGEAPVGFRAPGFSVSAKTLRVLAQRGYLYDASVFPNILGPLAQLFFNRSSQLSDDEKRRRKGVFGTFRNALRPIKPYFWQLDPDSETGRLLEIPVTSMPVFRTPIHMTYVLYLGRISPLLAMTYFRFALLACRLFRYQPSILLHPPDFLGCDDGLDMSFFPGMDVPSRQKLQLLDRLIGELGKHYTVVTLQEHARAILSESGSQLPFVPIERESTSDPISQNGLQAGGEAHSASRN